MDRGNKMKSKLHNELESLSDKSISLTVQIESLKEQLKKINKLYKLTLAKKRQEDIRIQEDVIRTKFSEAAEILKKHK